MWETLECVYAWKAGIDVAPCGTSYFIDGLQTDSAAVHVVHMRAGRHARRACNCTACPNSKCMHSHGDEMTF